MYLNQLSPMINMLHNVVTEIQLELYLVAWLCVSW